jgi:hypothetical protein
MYSMEITLKTAEDAAQWDTLLARASYKTIFHTWKWLKIVEKHTGTKLYPLIGFKGTDPIGILPIFYQKKGFFKLVFSPPSRTALVYLGPLIIDYESMKQGKRESTLFEFLKAVDKFIFSELKGNYIRINSAPGLIDSRPFKWNGYKVRTSYTLAFDLTRSLDSIWEGFSKTLREEINRSIKKEISIELGSIEDLDFIYDLLTKRLEERGIRLNSEESTFHPTKPYLHDIASSFFPQNLKVFIVKYKGEKVGGLVVLFYGNKSTSLIGAPKIDIKGAYPNSVLQWEIIKWAKENGFRSFESLDSGYSQKLSTYKTQFNPTLSIWFSTTKYSSDAVRLARVLSKIAKNDYVSL